jgi:Methylase involved in ubiquinone/menaquinone biosynthesis
MRIPRKISAQYSTVEADSLGDRVAARMRRIMFERFLACGVEATSSILDVGVTSDEKLEASNYLEAWYPHRDKITACGIDDAKFLEVRYPGVRYVEADGCALPFEDGHFDVVHSSAVLEHVGSHEQQRAFITELVRVSRRVVFLTTPNRWFPVEFHTVLPMLHWLPPRVFRAVLAFIGHDMLALEENLNLLGRSDIRALCREIGLQHFEVADVRLMGWPSNLLLTIRK